MKTDTHRDVLSSIQSELMGLRDALQRIAELPYGESCIAAEAVGIAQGALGLVEPDQQQCPDCMEHIDIEEEVLVVQKRRNGTILVCPACARAAEPQEICIGKHNEYSL